MLIAQQVASLVLDDIGQCRGVRLEARGPPGELIAEDKSNVAAVLVAHIDLLGQAQKATE